MFLWMMAWVCACIGARWAFAGLPGFADWSEAGRTRETLRRVGSVLTEIEETLAAGLLPPSASFDRLAALPAPWGALAHESLSELRSSGGALLPTLRRIRALASEHERVQGEARARSSQALAQAMVCGLMVPLFGSALYCLLPALEEQGWVWAGVCLAALLLAGAGAFWMLVIAENARWAGLPREARPWVLVAQCAGERFLALIRTGNPADLAWARACALVSRETPGLAVIWGASVWGGGARSGVHPSARVFDDAGASLRKAVQVSVMEGRPCSDRIETALLSLRQDLGAQVERELQLLGTRVLKPLFLCVAPALFLLLFAGLGLSWMQIGGVGAF